MLQKGAEYIRQLKMERAQLKEEIETHRQEVEALNAAINNCQSMLPATGAPVSRQRTNKMTEMFDQWVRIRTTENWKFWIVSRAIMIPSVQNRNFYPKVTIIQTCFIFL